MTDQEILAIIAQGITDGTDLDCTADTQAREVLRQLRAAGVIADADLVAKVTLIDALEALENLLDAITATDQHGDRRLTITGSTANLKWLLETEEDASAILAAVKKTEAPQ